MIRMQLSCNCEVERQPTYPLSNSEYCELHGYVTVTRQLGYEIGGYRNRPETTYLDQPWLWYSLSDSVTQAIYDSIDHPSAEKVLVTTTYHSIKSYSIEAWKAAIAALQYKNVEILIEDNSAAGGSPHQRIANSMETLRQKFLSSEAAWWLQIECDVIVQPNLIQILLPFAQNAQLLGPTHPLDQINHPGKTDWLAVPVPFRKRRDAHFLTFACSLFSRELAQVPFLDAPADRFTDGWYLSEIRALKKFNLIDLPPGLTPIAHLKPPKPEEDWY